MPRKKGTRRGMILRYRRASMRPGHCAPEKAPVVRGGVSLERQASMRPGHCAPEKDGESSRRKGARPARFNEAGALCPGKSRPNGVRSPRRWPASMRPGHCAPEKERRWPPISKRSTRFNEAGALCPGKRRRHRLHGEFGRRASMRPGHCAPEKGRFQRSGPSTAAALQ